MEEMHLIELLTKFGLDETDSKVFLELQLHESTSITILALKLNIERNKVYRILTKLRNRGLVISTFSNPVYYKSINMYDGLEKLISEKKDEVKSMIKIAKTIQHNQFTQKTDSVDKEKSVLSIIQGRSNVYSKIGKIIENAKNTIFLMTTPIDLINMYHTTIPEKMKIAKKNKVTVNIITEKIDGSMFDLIKQIPYADIRYANLPANYRIVTEENNLVLMSDVFRSSMNLNDPKDTIFFSTSIGIVNPISSFCKSLWDTLKET